MKEPKFKTPTGMHDIIGDDQRYYQKIYDFCQEMAHFYRFERIETPILEEAELFIRGVGIATDIVRKQMFSFKTRGGDYLTLRPEGTAPVVRAYIQQGMENLAPPVKLWYFGPFFRAEKPQWARFRQFWQFGFEVLGEESPVIDTQMIQIFYNLLKNLKFKNLIIGLNSIGCPLCRPHFKRVLTSYFRSRELALCLDCRRRLRENPLRILDCSEEKCQPLISQAPQILDHLCEDCHKHFKAVLEFCEELSLPYTLNPHLVRGLDYYTKTVFEIGEESEAGKKLGALVGGGRYDNLVKILGGRPTPAVGAAAGLERIIILMKERGMKLGKAPRSELFLAQLGELAKRKSLILIEEFRKMKIPLAELLASDSLKSQLAQANKMGAKYALILGQKEALEGEIIIKDMETGKQETVKLEKVAAVMKRKLKIKRSNNK
jgi:histidyl-tRNA synthetase